MSSYVFHEWVMSHVTHMNLCHTYGWVRVCLIKKSRHICDEFICVSWMSHVTRHTYELMPHIWMSSCVSTALMLRSFPHAWYHMCFTNKSCHTSHIWTYVTHMDEFICLHCADVAIFFTHAYYHMCFHKWVTYMYTCIYIHTNIYGYKYTSHIWTDATHMDEFICLHCAHATIFITQGDDWNLIFHEWVMSHVTHMDELKCTDVTIFFTCIIA